MNTIKRDVYVLRNTIKIPIEVTKGTDAISFEFTVRDYNLPATAAAVAYAYRGGMKKPNSTLCNVEDNVISFQPSANFFEVGMNELQIRVINEDKSLISFKEKVKCADSLGFPDEEEEKQIVFGTDDFFVDEKEDYQVEWIIPNAQKNQMEPILMTLYPHKKSHIQTSYTGEEFGYVLKGNITIMRGGKKYKVKAHETFYMDGAKSHYLYNHGNSPAKILWITTPPIF